MRYLVNVEDNSVALVDDDDDQRFNDLLAQRTRNNRPLYEQTGAHDPRVEAVTVPGQNPPNGQVPAGTPGDIRDGRERASGVNEIPPDTELSGDALKARAAELDIKGRSKMNADELRAAIAEAEAAGGEPETE